MRANCVSESSAPARIARERHLPGFQALPGVRVVGVCNLRRESAGKVAREFDIPKIYGNWEHLVEDDEIDAVVIGAWPYLHCPVTLAALDAGKHVLTEARMAMNAREARTDVRPRERIAEPHDDGRPQPLRPDRRCLHALADRRGLSSARCARSTCAGSRATWPIPRPRWAGGR